VRKVVEAGEQLKAVEELKVGRRAEEGQRRGGWDM
jgi:hypothetical protein